MAALLDLRGLSLSFGGLRVLQELSLHVVEARGRQTEPVERALVEAVRGRRDVLHVEVVETGTALFDDQNGIFAVAHSVPDVHANAHKRVPIFDQLQNVQGRRIMLISRAMIVNRDPNLELFRESLDGIHGGRLGTANDGRHARIFRVPADVIPRAALIRFALQSH